MGGMREDGCTRLSTRLVDNSSPIVYSYEYQL